VSYLSVKDRKHVTNVFTLKQFLKSSEKCLPDQIKINVAEHRGSLSTTEPDPDDRWIRNPFSGEEIHKIQGLSEEEQDKIVDLSIQKTF
jgi:hypothetical protein